MHNLYVSAIMAHVFLEVKNEGMFMKVKFWKLLGLLSIVIFVLSAANTAHAIGVTATINVGSGPWG
jgi:hypothetical protein